MDPENRKPDATTEREIEADLEQVMGAVAGVEKAEPPELIDQAVMNMARRELAAASRRRPLRWLGALGTLTVVVLALSIVVQQDQEQLPAAVPKHQNGLMLDAPRQKIAEPAKQSLDQAQAPLAAPPAETPGLARETVVRSLAESDAEAKVEDEEKPDQLAPEKWLERLLLLHQSGLYEQLEVELAEFKTAFPDHPLPAQLQD